METHTGIGWVSIVISIPDYLIAFYLYLMGVGDDSMTALMVITCLILTIIALITGLIARFGSGKDNFGIPGILSIVLVPILILGGL